MLFPSRPATRTACPSARSINSSFPIAFRFNSADGSNNARGTSRSVIERASRQRSIDRSVQDSNAGGESLGERDDRRGSSLIRRILTALIASGSVYHRPGRIEAVDGQNCSGALSFFPLSPLHPSPSLSSFFAFAANIQPPPGGWR